MRAVLVVGVALVLVGCGSTHEKQRASACRSAVTAGFRREGASTITTRTPAPQFGVTYCTYAVRAGGRRATVAVTRDANPQALKRFERAVVETDQAALWYHNPRDAPQQLNRIGVGADWEPGMGQLVATDGATLLTVNVKGVTFDAAKRLAVAAANGTLNRHAHATAKEENHGNNAAVIGPMI